MKRVYNFSAGPSELPEDVLRQAQSELLDWQGTGMSVMELPHRGQAFKDIAVTAEQDLRDLLKIPENYKVLFLHGGGRSQFSMVPMNLGKGYDSLVYVKSGTWSNFAIEEAERYGHVHIAGEFPDSQNWDIPENAAYFHYTDNETIQGIEFPGPPDSQGLPIITDMSSNLLSKPLDINQYGLIYACAQKNIGPAGITVVIVRDDLVAREPFDFTPTMMRYSVHAENASLYNTPATFPWYMAGLVFKWLKQQGGVEKMAEMSQAKADKLYNFIDRSDFYQNTIKPENRSRMNIVFTLPNDKFDAQFLKEAEKQALTNLKGHRSVGGMRASIYNPMPMSGIDALIEFMRQFEKQA